MTAEQFSWSPGSSIATLAATLFAGALAAQEPRPLELRSWTASELASRIATHSLALSGDVTGCTLVRCSQTASMFVSTRSPFGLELTTGLRLRDLGAAQLGGRSALGSVYLGYDAGRFRVWSGATTGHSRPSEVVTPDPAPGIESGFSTSWRRVGVAVSAAGGWLPRSTTGNRFAHASPVTREVHDSLGTHVDTVYVPGGDSTGISSNRWSSTEARVTWREEKWWITARAGRLASTRQAAAFWVGMQAGAQLSRDVSLLLGVGKSSRALTDLGEQRATPHVSLGFGFNTGILDHKEPRRDSSEAGGVASRPFAITDLGDGRYRVTMRIPTNGRSVEMACDCGGWKPVSMTRMGDAWVAQLSAKPGVHHVSIRVDGGGWIAPPALAPIDDDFAGQAGLLIVP